MLLNCRTTCCMEQLSENPTLKLSSTIQLSWKFQMVKAEQMLTFRFTWWWMTSIGSLRERQVPSRWLSVRLEVSWPLHFSWLSGSSQGCKQSFIRHLWSETFILTNSRSPLTLRQIIRSPSTLDFTINCCHGFHWIIELLTISNISSSSSWANVSARCSLSTLQISSSISKQWLSCREILTCEM